MKETGIIMSGSHPVDILEGRKTMTRRTWGLKEINKKPDDWMLIAVFQDGLARFASKDGKEALVRCPYGGYGDRLWAKETWAVEKRLDYLSPSELGNASDAALWYRADADQRSLLERGKWRPSIFMPRWASRITREITEVRAERLQAITEQDANAEGNPYPKMGGKGSLPPIWWFKELWDSLNAKRGYGWEGNWWVWPISFRMVLQSERK